MAETSAPLAALPFFDPTLGEQERIDDLVARLTLEEKIHCLSTNPSVPRLGVRASGHVEGLHGLSLGGPGGWGRDDPLPTTTFPQAIGLAHSWEPELLREVAEIEANEARYYFHHPDYQRGGIVVRAPNADLGRDPRWGRTEECYGEDPMLTASLAIAYVRGLQGDHPRYWRAAALLKHFLANSHEEGRERTSSDFGERLFREYYSLPFQRAITQGEARAFMAAYNAYNGVPCTVHPMLESIAVAEWGQDGIICTDGGAYKMLVTEHRCYQSAAEAAAACIKAGIGQFLDDYRAGVQEALDQGLLSESDLDRVVSRVFRVMLRLGLLDPAADVPFAQVARDAPRPCDTEAHRQCARRVTRETIVLLKNEGLLPLQSGSREGPVRSIAVIGDLADRVHLDWYSGTPPYQVTVLDGIRRRAASSIAVHAATNNDTSEMLRIARACDVAIVVLGNHPTGNDGWAKVARRSYGKEAVDRQTLDLEEEELAKKIWSVNPNTLLVLMSSFPYAINWSNANLPAIVHLTHNSQELGNALADVLFGDYNPSGRLVQTWPQNVEQLPPLLDYDITRGRTYRYFEGEPLYPFGYGLSYSSFVYSELEVGDGSAGPATLSVDTPLPLRVHVANTGARAGHEVVQAYVRFPNSAVPRPRSALVAFRRVFVNEGQAQQVELLLRAEDVCYWHAERNAFVLEAGEIELLIGRSSRDVQLRAVLCVSAGELPAPSRTVPS